MPARHRRVSVLVVDDQRTFAEALAIAIGTTKGVDVREARSGEHAIELAEDEPPTVVLMDLEMPGIGGVAATRRIRDVAPEAKVVGLSAHDEDVSKARAVEAGMVGYLSKLDSIDEIVSAVRRAAEGEILIDQEERERLLRVLRKRRHQQATERLRVNRLTRRQTQILQMMADGVPSREIAERLSMSPLTLRTHVQNILTRLGAHSKLEAVAIGIRQGTIRPRRLE